MVWSTYWGATALRTLPALSALTLQHHREAGTVVYDENTHITNENASPSKVLALRDSDHHSLPVHRVPRGTASKCPVHSSTQENSVASVIVRLGRNPR